MNRMTDAQKIPQYLLCRSKIAGFNKWLEEQPLTRPDKYELIRLYEKVLNINYTFPQIIIMVGEKAARNGTQE